MFGEIDSKIGLSSESGNFLTSEGVFATLKPLSKYHID